MAHKKYMAEYYIDKKWPTAALFLPTKSRDAAITFKEDIEGKTRKDTQNRPIFRFDPDAKHKPEVVKMMDTPQEMEFIQVREEARNRVAAFYGISPIFNADVAGSGGLNNESQQITVMSWAIETKQTGIKKNFLDRITKNIGVFDWNMQLDPIEEEDEASEVALEQAKAQYAQCPREL